MNRPAFLKSVASKVISKFVDLSYTKQVKRNNQCQDNVIEYAKETLTMGRLLLEFKDAVREGDGDRVLGAGSICFCISGQLVTLITAWKH